MKRAVVIASILILSTLAPSARGAHGRAATRTVAFHATYAGHFVGSISTPSKRSRFSGTATMLGNSTLTSHDVARQQFPGAGRFGVLTQGMGVITAPMGTLKFAYMMRHVAAGNATFNGYYIIFDGTGALAGSHGSGRLQELIVTHSSGQAATDSFSGTLTFR